MWTVIRVIFVFVVVTLDDRAVVVFFCFYVSWPSVILFILINRR